VHAVGDAQLRHLDQLDGDSPACSG
jgi:hypothetical protein